MPYSLAKGLVHEVCVVDPDDALVLLKQALLSRATFLFYTSDVQTQWPVGDKTAWFYHRFPYDSADDVSQTTDSSVGVAQTDQTYG